MSALRKLTRICELPVYKPTFEEIEQVAYYIWLQRVTATEKDDWDKARSIYIWTWDSLSLGEKRDRAHALYQGRTTRTADDDWYEAERDLTYRRR